MKVSSISIGFTGCKHLALGILEAACLVQGDELRARTADHGARLLAEHVREGLVDQHEFQCAVLDEDRILDGVDDAFGESGTLMRFRKLALAVLHLGDVVVGDEALAARQCRHRVDHRAAIGASELTRRDVACPDLGEP